MSAAAVPAGAWLEGPCPQCEAGWRCPAADAQRPACSACSAPAAGLHAEQVADDGSLRGCLACGHDEMYWARDFPKTLGLAVVVVAGALAPFTMYISLAVGAVIDALLVFTVGKRLHCYRCGAVHHRFAQPEAWAPFNLEVSDLHRFGERSAVARTLASGRAHPHARRRDEASAEA